MLGHKGGGGTALKMRNGMRGRPGREKLDRLSEKARIEVRNQSLYAKNLASLSSLSIYRSTRSAAGLIASGSQERRRKLLHISAGPTSVTDLVALEWLKTTTLHRPAPKHNYPSFS